MTPSERVEVGIFAVMALMFLYAVIELMIFNNPLRAIAFFLGTLCCLAAIAIRLKG